MACSLVILMVGFSDAAGQALSPVDRSLAELYARLEQVLVAGNRDGFTALAAPSADPSRLTAFASQHVLPGGTRAVVRERDRLPDAELPEDRAFTLLLEVFVEYGARGAIRTWRVDVRRDAAEAGWRISDVELLSMVDGLNRLALSPTRQFRVSNLQVTAEDLTIAFPTGTAYVAEAAEGQTALVIIGAGTMRFAPAPDSERGQLRIFADADTLESKVDSVFLRVNPMDLGDRVKGSLVAEPVWPPLLRRAQAIFSEEIGKSFGLELNDLSRDAWSLVPPAGDFIAEMRTARFGTLTYTRSSGEAEDISLFNRKRRRNIAVYASRQTLATRGNAAYSEDDQVDYDVEHYAVTANLDPDRLWVDGRTELRLRIRAVAVGTLTLRLAEPLVVRSVVGAGFGRLLALRVKGQNSVIVNLPRTLTRDTTVTLAVVYSGRLPGILPDREAVLVDADAPQDTILREDIGLVAEPRTLYSQRSYWYPQAQVTDYATGVLRLTVPSNTGCLATGVAASGNPVRVEGARPGETWQRYVFTVDRPARYFAALLTRLDPAARTTLTAPRRPVTSTTEASAVEADVPPRLDLDVRTNPRQAGRGRALVGQASTVLSVYADLVGDYPYPTFTLAAVDDTLPGGHSPAYFAMLHQPLPISPFSWRNDPVAFEGFPQFFLAHEIAHQYWGNAVGWESYHEQWISEGFAQYFALLYAERTLTPGQVLDIRRKLKQTALDNGRHGPIWLGYRLGHLQEDGRIFRALVYNKSAIVLHMLRRWLGDEPFFRGLRQLYQDSRFRKIGTRHVRRAFEEASGQTLDRFFQRWIFGAATPTVQLRVRVESGPPPTSPTGEALSTEAIGVSTVQGPASARETAVVQIEQRGDVFDLPVTLTIQYANGQTEERLVRLSDAVTELRLPLAGPLRSIELNRDEGALVEVQRQ